MFEIKFILNLQNIEIKFIVILQNIEIKFIVILQNIEIKFIVILQNIEMKFIVILQNIEIKFIVILQNIDIKLIVISQNIDSTTPKKEREDALRNQKVEMSIRQKELEENLDRHQRNLLEFEIRKFRRRRYLQHHQLEAELLREVGNWLMLDWK